MQCTVHDCINSFAQKCNVHEKFSQTWKDLKEFSNIMSKVNRLMLMIYYWENYEQGWVRKPVNADPELNVNWSIIFFLFKNVFHR